jgi:hypothetical protein
VVTIHIAGASSGRVARRLDLWFGVAWIPTADERFRSHRALKGAVRLDTTDQHVPATVEGEVERVDESLLR